VAMNSSIFCDITPCSPVKVIRRFGRTYSFYLQIVSKKPACNKHQATKKTGISGVFSVRKGISNVTSRRTDLETRDAWRNCGWL
jgi:hypothetical protein